MKRSDFLKSLGLGAGGLIIPNTSFIRTEKIKIYDNYIKGLQHYKYKKVKSILRVGDDLFLKRDKGNKYDSYAVEVFWQDKKLGYIAAFENIIIANLLDQGVHLTSKISQLLPNDLYNGAALEVYAELVIPSDKLITMIDEEFRADDANDRYRNSMQ